MKNPFGSIPSSPFFMSICRCHRLRNGPCSQGEPVAVALPRIRGRPDPEMQAPAEEDAETLITSSRTTLQPQRCPSRSTATFDAIDTGRRHGVSHQIGSRIRNDPQSAKEPDRMSPLGCPLASSGFPLGSRPVPDSPPTHLASTALDLCVVNPLPQQHQPKTIPRRHGRQGSWWRVSSLRMGANQHNLLRRRLRADQEMKLFMAWAA